MDFKFTKKNKKIIFISFAFLVVIGIFFIFQSFKTNFTGEVIEEIESEEEVFLEEFEITCSDSDNGRDYFSKGFVEYCDELGDCINREDSCVGEKVMEWYCVNNELNFENYECNGICDEGVCANLVTEYETSSSSSSGGGGGGGGSSSGSSGTPAPSFQTSNLGELVSEYPLEFLDNEGVIFIVSNISYVLGLQSHTPASSAFYLGGQVFSFDVSQEQQIDLNSDGVQDVYIKLKSINLLDGKVKLILRPS